MDTSSALRTKDRIYNLIIGKGPSLPVHISKEVGIDPLFVSAFMAELKSDNKLRISDMKVGSSPLYYLPEQKMQLENFSQYLNQREREAFNLLRENKVLID